jgi:hypothetical protein
MRNTLPISISNFSHLTAKGTLNSTGYELSETSLIGTLDPLLSELQEFQFLPNFTHANI